MVFRKFIFRGYQYLPRCDTQESGPMDFDDIIVGGGSAGALLAARNVTYTAGRTRLYSHPR